MIKEEEHLQLIDKHKKLIDEYDELYEKYDELKADYDMEKTDRLEAERKLKIVERAKILLEDVY